MSYLNGWLLDEDKGSGGILVTYGYLETQEGFPSNLRFESGRVNNIYLYFTGIYSHILLMMMLRSCLMRSESALYN